MSEPRITRWKGGVRKKRRRWPWFRAHATVFTIRITDIKYVGKFIASVTAWSMWCQPTEPVDVVEAQNSKAWTPEIYLRGPFHWSTQAVYMNKFTNYSLNMIFSLLLSLVVLASRVSAYRVDLFHEYEYLGIQRSFVRCHEPFHIHPSWSVQHRWRVAWNLGADARISRQPGIHWQPYPFYFACQEVSLTHLNISGVHVIEFPAKSWIWDAKPGEDCCVLFCVAGRARVCAYNDSVTTSLDVPSSLCRHFRFAASPFHSNYFTPHPLASFPIVKGTDIYLLYLPHTSNTIRKKLCESVLIFGPTHSMLAFTATRKTNANPVFPPQKSS